VSADRLGRLLYACELHADGHVTDDPTVGACWDANRLDIARYGMRLLPTLLSTERARLEAERLPEPMIVTLGAVLDIYRERLTRGLAAVAVKMSASP
jgi:hypothetical protein